LIALPENLGQLCSFSLGVVYSKAALHVKTLKTALYVKDKSQYPLESDISASSG